MESYNLQFASDLHLDSSSPPFSMLLEPSVPDLALCGDIGNPWTQIYADFLTWCSIKFKRVFLISGNHEYFSDDKPHTIAETDKKIRAIVAKINKHNETSTIVFLQKDIFLIESHKICIVGETLWSVPDLRHWDIISPGFIGDPGLRGEYKAIYKRDEYTGAYRTLHPSDITLIASEHQAYLNKVLNTTWGSIPEGWRVIVLTHHLPSYSLNPQEFNKHPLKSCYSNSLEHLFKEPVVAWLCGHSHTAMIKRYDTGCLVALNPLGYANEAGKSNYSRNAIATVTFDNFATIKGLK
jgi:predicted phosphodiesterase